MPATSWEGLRADRVLYEDASVLVLDKPPGLAVEGERNDVDVNTLAREAGEFVMAVHRIDKVTTGAVVFAKTRAAHAALTNQFRERRVAKRYLSVVRATAAPGRGSIDLPLTAGRKGRMRVAAPRSEITWDADRARWRVDEAAVLRAKPVYPSRTGFAAVWESGGRTLLVALPYSGRRHQIRVHCAWVGWPIEGDPLFDRAVAPGDRTYLHSWSVAFDSPDGDRRRVRVEAPPAPDFWQPFAGGLPDGRADELLARARRLAGTDGSTGGGPEG